MSSSMNYAPRRARLSTARPAARPSARQVRAPSATRSCGCTPAGTHARQRRGAAVLRTGSTSPTGRAATSAGSACPTRPVASSLSTGARRPPSRSTRPPRPSRAACCAAADRHARPAGRGRRGRGAGPRRFRNSPASTASHVVIGEGALFASLDAARSGRMRDIVATIQADQDRVIRAPLSGVLVVQGGPGTGKTAVALAPHRVPAVREPRAHRPLGRTARRSEPGLPALHRPGCCPPSAKRTRW